MTERDEEAGGRGGRVSDQRSWHCCSSRPSLLLAFKCLSFLLRPTTRQGSGKSSWRWRVAAFRHGGERWRRAGRRSWGHISDLGRSWDCCFSLPSHLLTLKCLLPLLKTGDTRVSGNVVLATERQYIDDELVVVVEQQPDSGAEMWVLFQMHYFLCWPLASQGWRSSELRRSQGWSFKGGAATSSRCSCGGRPTACV